MTLLSLIYYFIMYTINITLYCKGSSLITESKHLITSFKVITNHWIVCSLKIGLAGCGEGFLIPCSSPVQFLIYIFVGLWSTMKSPVGFSTVLIYLLVFDQLCLWPIMIQPVGLPYQLLRLCSPSRLNFPPASWKSKLIQWSIVFQSDSLWSNQIRDANANILSVSSKGDQVTDSLWT